MLNRSGDVRTCIISDYDIAGVSSRRSRQPHEQQILEERHDEIRVIQLVGALTFATIDYLSRQLSGRRPNTQLLILDFRRVPNITKAAARLIGEVLASLANRGVTTILAGFEAASPLCEAIRAWTADAPKLRQFSLLDDAIEWAEDQIIYRYGGFVRLTETICLGEQALLAGLTPEEIAELAGLGAARSYQAGQRIIGADEPATSLFFLQSGMVSVKLRSGVRLASLVPGMAFGEMALIEHARSADVWADTAVQCLELSLSAYAGFRKSHPESGERIMRNLATLLARRLILVNIKVDLLSAY